jgi:hypothetical protein
MPRKYVMTEKRSATWKIVLVVVFGLVLFAPEICLLLGVENAMTNAMKIGWGILALCCVTFAILKRFTK